MEFRPTPLTPAPHDLETLREVGAAVAAASGALKVVLFGSVARGDARKNSDLDLLLVMPDEAFVGRSLFEQTAPAGRARRALRAAGFRFPVDVLPTSSASFEVGGSLINLEARRDGIVLYDAHGATGEELPALVAGSVARRG